jgi:hypothetical protein
LGTTTYIGGFHLLRESSTNVSDYTQSVVHEAFSLLIYLKKGKKNTTKNSRFGKKLSGTKSRRFILDHPEIWVKNLSYGRFGPNRLELILDGLPRINFYFFYLCDFYFYLFIFIYINIININNSIQF